MVSASLALIFLFYFDIQSKFWNLFLNEFLYVHLKLSDEIALDVKPIEMLLHFICHALRSLQPLYIVINGIQELLKILIEQQLIQIWYGAHMFWISLRIHLFSAFQMFNGLFGQIQFFTIFLIIRTDACEQIIHRHVKELHYPQPTAFAHLRTGLSSIVSRPQLSPSVSYVLE